MVETTLVFPHQLYDPHPATAPGRPVVLVEEHLFFRQYRFHRQKLILHRASLRAYADRLRMSGLEVEYVEATEQSSDIRHLLTSLAARGCQRIHVPHLTDDWLSKRLAKAVRQTGLSLETYPDPGFLHDTSALDAFFEGRKRYFQTDFYTARRKRMGILMERDGTPAGGRWTFDTDNRKRYPAGGNPPPVPLTHGDEYTKEAEAYVALNFPHSPGEAAEPFAKGYPWAWTHEGASALLDDFLSRRFKQFGDYEDAMVAKEHFLHHSVLSPMLNIGLITPAEVLDRALSSAEANGIPLNSLEGFVRQVLGWREFIRAVYLREGVLQRTRNYWGFHRRIPASFYEGTTGIVPFDGVLRKVLRTGYAHHIERLMVLGNFLLLCEFDPDEVYRWFMELFIDAYDWVMVPNVYGMTQFADGGLMTTKPYISGSNYLTKMGDWEAGAILPSGHRWGEIWDALFWRFMHVHRDFFLSNPRLGMLVGTFDRMQPAKRERHLAVAEAFLASLDEPSVK
jgi:deoxyribodipyrimidine photolyase-related protein